MIDLYFAAGYYMLLQSRYGQNGDTAVLISPLYNVTSPTQLSIHFHMKMPTKELTARLEVFLVTALRLPLLKAFSKVGNYGENWNEERLCLPTGSYMIQFIGTQGKTFDSDIGLDNIKLDGDCNSPLEFNSKGKCN